MESLSTSWPRSVAGPGRATACTFGRLPPRKPPRATELFEQIKEFLLGDCSELHASEVGRRVEESFRQLQADGCELLGVLKPYGTWDHVLFILRMFTRAVVACDRFCEMFYVYGLGHSGKDVLFLVIMSFLGTLPFQYGVMLPGTYLTASGGSRDQATPYMARLESKRLVWASEIPAHTDLNVEFLKPWCEQAGAPVCSRGLNKDPRDFRPSGLLVCTSNSPPVIKDRADDGFTRRARVWQTCGKFVKHPTLITEQKADDGLKPKIMRGHYNKFLLYLVENLVDTLDSAYNPGTQLCPKPGDMCELEEAMTKAEAGARTVASFLEQRCTLVKVQLQASKYSDFIAALASYLGVSEQQARMDATRAGVCSKGAGKFKAAVSKEGGWQLNPTSSEP